MFTVRVLNNLLWCYSRGLYATRAEALAEVKRLESDRQPAGRSYQVVELEDADDARDENRHGMLHA
jgi:hypothetical protein